MISKILEKVEKSNGLTFRIMTSKVQKILEILAKKQLNVMIVLQKVG